MNTVLTKRLPEIERAWQALREDRYDQAMRHAQQAMKKLPDDPDVAHILGVLASRDGRQDIALPLLQKAIDQGGVTERRLRDITKALLQAGHPQAALAPLEDAIRQFGESAELLGLRAAIEAALERWEDAARSAQTAIAMAPHLMAWEGTLAFCELIRQNWSTGFRAWSGRAENLPAGSRCPALRPDTPGELWIRNEQGPGDTLFFLRFAAPLAAHGWKLHVQSDRKTLPLLQELFASVEERCKCPADGFWLNAGELPLAAQQIGAEAVQPSLPLQPDPHRVEKMRAELAALGPAPYIAVSWRGGARGRKERRGLRLFDKYVDPAALGKVLASCGGTIISIQRVPDTDEFIAFSRALGRRVADYSALNNNLPGMLALLEVVDEYIAVPNTNVHLREALGKPSHILLNRPWQDWRWLDEGDKSPWYPQARIYRQDGQGGWKQALDDMKHQLQLSLDPVADAAAATIIDEVSIRQDAQRRTLAEGWDALKEKNIAAAIGRARQVLAQLPENADALHLLGWAALQDFKFDLAASVLEKAASLAPDNGPLRRDYLRALGAAGRYEAALAEAEQALSNPELQGKAAIYYGRAAIHLQQGMHEAALADYATCLELAPHHLDALAYSGMIRLRLGEARRGFREYSARPEARRVENHVCPWLRGDERGLKLLVRREMGLGDELTYLRYLPWLAQAGIEVTYWAGAKLATIMQRTGYAATVLADNTPCPDVAGFDLAIEVNEIPVAVEALGAPEIAPPLPLSPRPELIEKWRHWLNTLGPGPYIGLNWRAGAASRETSLSFNRLAKAIDPDLLARTMAPVQATWISLQRHVTSSELENFRKRLGAEVHDAAGLTDDLEDLLALLSLLDENIGVSNTNMHLRAGLGLGSRVLVQNPGSDWRWSHEGSSSPWFDQSKVYRQQLGGNWSLALEALQDDLVQRHSKKRASESLADLPTTLPVAPEILNRPQPSLTTDNPDTRIRIVMAAQFAPVWPSWRSVWQALNNHADVVVQVVHVPYIQAGVTEKAHAEMRALLQGEGVEYQAGEDFDLEAFAPHLVFLQNPYDATRPENWRVGNLTARGYRLAYIPYGIEMGGGELNLNYQFNLALQQNAWRIFSRSERSKRMYAKYCKSGDAQVVVTGHPKFDAQIDFAAYPVPEQLKKKIAGRKVLLWTPHFSVGLPPRWSTYRIYGAEIMRQAESHPDLFLIIRPHPKFFQSMLRHRVWNEADEADFRSLCEERDDLWLDENPDYLQAFAVADGLMADVGSFLLEFLPTGKPILYLHHPDGLGLNDDADYVDYLYQADKPEHIGHFFTQIKSAQDPKRTLRLSATSEFLYGIEGQAGQRICDHIVDAIKHEASASSAASSRRGSRPVKQPAFRIDASNMGSSGIHLQTQTKKEKMLSHLLSCLPRIGHVLDIGCGDGQYTRLLAQKADAVDAYDICPETIKRAIAQAEKQARNITFHAKSHEQIELTSEVDLISCMEFSCLVVDDKKFNQLFHALHQHIKPGGHLLLVANLALGEDKLVTAPSALTLRLRNVEAYRSFVQQLGFTLEIEMVINEDLKSLLSQRLFLFSRAVTQA